MRFNAAAEDIAPLASQSLRHADKRIPNFCDERQVPTVSRLLRVDPQGPLVVEGSRLAQLTVLNHGGSERPIITRGGKHLRSRLGSRKTHLQQITEGRAHRDLARYDEVNPNVVDYQAHPFKIEFANGGTREVYYPDHVRQMVDGTIELIEVKRTPADLSDATYCAKLAAVAEIARRIGWTFRILYHADIKGPRWRMVNVEAAYMHRLIRLDRTVQSIISDFVVQDQPQGWDELRERVSPGRPHYGEAILYGCVALGRISIDLDLEVNNETIVTPRKPVRSAGGFRL